MWDWYFRKCRVTSWKNNFPTLKKWKSYKARKREMLGIGMMVPRFLLKVLPTRITQDLPLECKVWIWRNLKLSNRRFTINKQDTGSSTHSLVYVLQYVFPLGIKLVKGEFSLLSTFRKYFALNKTEVGESVWNISILWETSR